MRIERYRKVASMAETGSLQSFRFSKRWWIIRLSQLILFASMVGIWEAASDRWIRELWISRPSLIADTLIECFSSDFIYSHIYASVKVAVLGLTLGFLAGHGDEPVLHDLCGII